MPLDCHLMIDDPDRWAVGLRRGGRAQRHRARGGGRATRWRWRRTCARPGRMAGLSVKPGTPLEPLPGDAAALRHAAGDERRARLRRAGVHARGAGQGAHRPPAGRHRAPHRCWSRSTAASTPTRSRPPPRPGVDCFVAGSAVYGADDPARAVAGAARAGARPRRTAAAPATSDVTEAGSWMFTGIVEEIGEVVAVRESADVVVLTVRGPHGHHRRPARRLDRGERGLPDRGRPRRQHRRHLHRRAGARDAASARAWPRSRAGARVNLERAVPVGGRLGGHIVQGHVDGVATAARPARPASAATSCASACPPTWPATSWRRARSRSTGCR